MMPKGTILERKFWSQVDKSGDCWEWTGYLDADGYGKYSAKLAHRVAFKLSFGNIPQGMIVCHHCDNPKCVRPDHLYLGTVLDNVRDKMRKGRHRNGWPTKPEAMLAGINNRASYRLDPAKVEAIRTAYQEGETNYSALKRKFGVSYGSVLNIVKCRGAYADTSSQA